MSTLLMPYYQLFIGGKELDDFRYSMIQSITFEDNASGSDLLSITITDPDFIFINDDIFLEDKKVKFIGGYSNDNRVMFEGYISVIDMDFPEIGSPSLVINCMDNTHLMNRVKKKKTWSNVTRGAVAKEIFQEYGFKAVIEDSGAKVETLNQSNETDINFLIKLAGEEVEPYLLYLEGNTGYFVKKKILDTQQATLDYRDGQMNIISFSPTINKETKQIEVRSSDVNLKDKAVDKAQANNNSDRNVSGKDVTSTDRNNGKPSWQYGGSGKWTQTY